MGDLLLRAGLVTDAQLLDALGAQRERRKRLGEILREDGVIDEVALAAVLAVQLDTPLVDLRERPSDEAAMRTLSEADARRLWVMPLAFSGRADEDLLVATDDPGNQTMLDEVAALVGRPVIPLLSLRSEIDDAIRHRYRVGDLAAQVTAFTSTRPAAAPVVARTAAPQLQALETAPVVQIVNLLVAQALRDRASDLHLEPHARACGSAPASTASCARSWSSRSDLAPGLVSRIKIMAELNIVEKQRAQDGQFELTSTASVDIRVATMRTIWGEKAVLRLLDRDGRCCASPSSACRPTSSRVYQRLLGSPLRDDHRGRTHGQRQDHDPLRVDRRDRPRDAQRDDHRGPGRVHLPDVNQIQVNAAGGLTFALGLRAILRQDPDVILVGEMRDRETAEIAVQASMTGHLVLSSMHATDAVSALFRLLEMGIEPFLVSASVTGVIGQRLMRRVCSHCRIEIEPTAEEQSLYEAAG